MFLGAKGSRSTFSGAFQSGAFSAMPKTSIIFIAFMNIAEYALFTLCCFYLARPPQLIVDFVNTRLVDSKVMARLPQWLRRPLRLTRMSKEQTVAVCYCGAAKTIALGIPIVSAMWNHADNLTRANLQIPVLLYTIEQVFIAQLLTYFFRWYVHRHQKETGPGDAETASKTDQVGQPVLGGNGL